MTGGIEKIPCGVKGCEYGVYLASMDKSSHDYAVRTIKQHRVDVHHLADGELKREDRARLLVDDFFGGMFG